VNYPILKNIYQIYYLIPSIDACYVWVKEGIVNISKTAAAEMFWLPTMKEVE